MVATISIPGGSNFTYKYFPLRGRALEVAVGAWRRSWLGADPSQEALSAAQQGLVLSDKEARKVRWQDGRRVFNDF